MIIQSNTTNITIFSKLLINNSYIDDCLEESICEHDVSDVAVLENVGALHGKSIRHCASESRKPHQKPEVAGNLVSDSVSINNRRYYLDVAIASEVDDNERKYK